VAREAFPPGTEFLLISVGAAVAEEKVVSSLEERSPVLDLRFEPPTANPDLQFSLDATLCRWGRRFRLFGHDAPPSFIRQKVVNGEVQAEQVSENTTDYDLRVPGGDTLRFDRVVDGLQAGQELVLASSSGVFRRKVAAVTTTATQLGLLAATVTQVKLDSGVWQASDANRPTVREVTVYELLPPEIALWTLDWPRSVDGSELFVPLADGAPPIERGRTVMVDDAAAEPVARTVAGTDLFASYGEGPTDHQVLFLDSPLPRALDAATAVLRGNVVDATHGESVPLERLGIGDATIAFQRFRLGKAPLTRVPRAGAPHGAAPELTVYVAGLRWHETDEFVGHEPGDRVYVLEIADDGTSTVIFGDGQTGSRLATGAEVVADYRQGLGSEGRVHVGQLTSLLDRPKGLKGATNPLDAEGGADAETLEDAREAAPGTVRTLGRVVSLRDFEDAARESALVAKARAIVALGDDETGVRLTVAGEDGAHLDDAIALIRADIDARRDPYRRLEIVDYTPIGVRIQATVIARDEDRVGTDVQEAARNALLGELAFDNRQLGQALHASDVLAAMQAATGVVGVDLDVLRYADDADRVSHGMPDEDVLAHVAIGADELVTLNAADLQVDVR
jgi:hypothetical protein